MQHYKRAFSTLTCIDATVEEVISYALRHQFDAVELRLDSDQNICGHSPEETPELRRLFEDAGIAVSDLASGVTFTGADDAMLETGKRCVNLAAVMGAKGVRIFLGKGTSLFSVEPQHDFDGIVSMLCALCDYAAEKNVEIWAETHGEFSPGKEMRRVLDAVREKGSGGNLYVIWDLIHSIEYREEPADTLRYLWDDVVHIHLKDGVFSGNPDAAQYIHTRLGEGEMKLGTFLSLLNGTGFNGCLSLEWEAPWRAELRGVYENTDAVFDAYNAWVDSAEAESAESIPTSAAVPAEKKPKSHRKVFTYPTEIKPQKSRKILFSVGTAAIAVGAVAATLILGRKHKSR